MALCPGNYLRSRWQQKKGGNLAVTERKVCFFFACLESWRMRARKKCRLMFHKTLAKNLEENRTNIYQNGSFCSLILFRDPRRDVPQTNGSQTRSWLGWLSGRNQLDKSKQSSLLKATRLVNLHLVQLLVEPQRAEKTTLFNLKVEKDAFLSRVSWCISYWTFSFWRGLVWIPIQYPQITATDH